MTTAHQPHQAVAIEEAPPGKKVLYVQYTNAAGYPPLQHSSQILARAGWKVVFLGIKGRMVPPLEFPPHPRIEVRQMPWCEPGWKQKLHFLRFIAWTVWHALSLRPDWVYASEQLSATSARLIQLFTRCRVVYHEHDSPVSSKVKSGFFAKAIEGDRKYLATHAEMVVLPNEERLKAFVAEFPPKGKTACVWNCPSLTEVADERESRPQSQPLMVLYHGSIVPDRFPLANLQALAQCGRNIHIRLIGYETVGSKGYVNELKAEAERLGVADRFEYLGTLPQRSDLMRRCGECDVGLSLLRIHDKDINMLHMAGASNKPFDYLSQGLALIVPNDPAWMKLYVDNGCGMACDPSSTEALATLFTWMDDHRDEVRKMGQTGQNLVRSDWNYEAQFRHVLEAMTHC